MTKLMIGWLLIVGGLVLTGVQLFRVLSTRDKHTKGDLAVAGACFGFSFGCLMASLVTSLISW